MESNIVKKAKRGNKKAFEILIRQVSHEGYRLAFYYLKHEADSQDALGQAIEKAYKNIKKLNEVDKFKHWFMSIVVNESKMMLRKRSKNNIVELESVKELYETEKDKELVIDLQNALNHLDEEDRTILMLKFYEGYTFREIGGLLDMPESTVKTRHYSLLNKLKSDLMEKEKRYAK